MGPLRLPGHAVRLAGRSFKAEGWLDRTIGRQRRAPRSLLRAPGVFARILDEKPARSLRIKISNCSRE